MSKTKKIISMLLAVVMTLSLAPASVLASAFDISVNGSDSAENVTTPGYIRSTPAVSYDIDTVGTTEVIRVAANAVNSCEYGTTIVPEATPSGMPKITSGTFANVAYAGETPEKIYVKINFKNGAQPDEAPTLSSSLAAAMSFSNASKTTSGTTTTYTWTVTGGSANPGTGVLYTFSYKMNNVDYVSYASAHVENILRPNGALSVGYRRVYQTWKVTYYYTRVSALLLFQGKNVYSGWVAGGGSDRGYIDYGSGQALDGGAIAGCGSDGFKPKSDGGYAIGDNDNGTVRRWYDGRKSEANSYFGHGYDNNRPLSTVYLDDAENETVDSLNIRFTYQSGETTDCNYSYLNGVGVYQAEGNPGGLSGSKDFSDNYPVGDSVFSLVTPIKGCVTGKNGDGTRFVPANVTSSGNDNHKITYFTGSGNSTATYTVGISSYGQLDDSSQTDRWVQVHAGVISFHFKRYDTTSLRQLLDAIRLNTGVSYNNTTYYNGAYPNERYYTEGWSTFFNAYQNALHVISAPDIYLVNYTSKQTEIEAVATSLKQAYAGLQGYRANVNYTVNYTNTDSNVALLPSRTGTVNVGETLLTSAPVIQGYTCQDAIQNTTNFIDGTTDINITYSYLPATNQIVIITNNDEEAMPNVGCQYGKLLPINAMNAELGTKAFYEFAGWYYDEDFTNPVTSSDRMPATNLTVFAKWNPAPRRVLLDPKISGTEPYQIGNSITPDPNGPVYFQRPADPSIEGYIFVEFYADENLETLVEWPIEFNLGDSDKTIYARFEDVYGKISFESMGGTPVPSKTYTANDPITQPDAPTRQGYDFAGWFFDRNYTQPVNGWTVASYEGGEIVGSAPSTGTYTRDTMTGFVAYARWTPQIHTISFETGIDYYSEPSKFNTRNSSLASISGYSDSAISQEDLDFVVIPTRFGYEFANWTLNGVRYDLNKYPTSDITLTAAWRPVDYSAFVDILAYKMLDGEAVSVNEDDYGTGEGLVPIENKPEVMKGDIITFRMSSKTNFYVGSSLFVFMYDKNFYDLVGTGASAFKLNPDNDYIDGLGVLDAATPTYTAVTNSSMLRWPEGMDQSNYAAMQIAIDPYVTVDDYFTEPMQDESWILEFKLRIKDNATGSGEVFMDNSWTRTPENPMGTMFYGWSSNRAPVMNTTNNLVVPDLKYTHSTVTVGDATPVETTVTVNSVNGALAGQFPNGTTTNTYTGRASTEILDYVGTPSLYGYHLDEGEEFVDANGNFWIEGYYPPEEFVGTPLTYNANWKVNNWSAKFYRTMGDTSAASLAATETTSYNMPLANVPTLQKIRGYLFAGWLDANGADVDFTTYKAPNNDDIFFAKWIPDDNTYTINYMYGETAVKSPVIVRNYSRPVDGELVQTTVKTENIIKIVNAEDVPAVWEDNIVYVTAESLDPGVNGYGFDPEANTLPITAVVGVNGVTITIQCKKVPLNDTFRTNNSSVTFSNGETSMTYSGLEGTTYAENGINEIEIPVRPGYTFTGYTTGSGASAVTWDPSVLILGRTWRAGWQIKNFTVEFINETTQEVYKTGSVNYDANIIAPAAPTQTGYTFAGWKLKLGENEYGPLLKSNELGTLSTEGDRTYVAVFNINNYNVSYTVDGEAYGESEELVFGSTHNFRADPEVRIGYDFFGWYLPDDAETQHDATETFTVPASALVITGRYVAKQCSVEFDANGGEFEGGELVKPVPTVFDATITAPEAAPTRAGYRFEGWSESDNNDIEGRITNFGTLDQETGKKFYAIWTALEVSYYVDVYKMDVNGTYSSAPTTQTFEGLVDSTVTYTPAPADPGFHLVGDEELSGKVLADGSLRFEVRYARNQHNVYRKLEESASTSELVTEGVYYGATIPTPEEYTNSDKPGYDFNGYSCEYTTMPDADVTFIGSWTALSYTVNFFLTQEDFDLGRAPVSSMNLPYQSAIFAASTEREGYTFDDWARAGSTQPVTFDESLTVSLGGDNFVGLWTINKYPLYYKSNNVTVASYEGENAIPYGTPASQFPAPPTLDPREGYEFKGWNPSPYSTMPANESGITITAKWDKESYSIFFDVDGGTPDYEPIEDVEYLTDISDRIPYSQPTREGYTFAGWSEPIPTVMPDLGANGASKTITALWTINKYEISFNSNEGSPVEAIRQNFNTAVSAPAQPVREGHTFDYWYETDESDEYEFTVMPARNVELTAKWNANPYTITFDADGGKFAGDKATEAVTTTFDEEIVVPTAPTREGYTFGGWYEIDENTLYNDFSAMPAREFTLKAKWNINSYEISFDVDNGTAVETPQTLEFNSDIVLPTTTREGYTFGGWYEGESAFTLTKMPARAVALKAKWNIDDYTITFDANGGKLAGDKATEAVTTTFGEEIAVPTAPTREGYTFGGWYEIDENTLYNDFSAMPAREFTLKAKWTINQYTIYFDAGEGEFADDVNVVSTEYDYNADTAKYATDPYMEGYTFVYWYEIDEALPYDFDKMPARNVELKAKWNINEYVISFDTKGGDHTVKPIVADFDVPIAAPAKPVKEGHSFVDWYEKGIEDVPYNFPKKMPARNVELEAKWNVLSYSVQFYDLEGNVISDANYSYGTQLSDILLPDDLARPYYTFEGWTLKEGGSESAADAYDFANSQATVGVEGFVFYPIFVKVPVELVKLEESTAIVEDEILPERGVIYGLETGLSEQKLIEEYISFIGSGEIVVTPSLQGKNYSICGTGTIVDLYDTETTNLVASYYIVIFGDINGDGITSAVDVSLAETEMAREEKTWSAPDSAASFKLKAVDTDNDGVISAAEKQTLSKVALKRLDFVQIDGTTVAHKKS